jgi:hypothetical protein
MIDGKALLERILSDSYQTQSGIQSIKKAT